jgi:hypothetical protein
LVLRIFKIRSRPLTTEEGRGRLSNRSTSPFHVMTAATCRKVKLKARKRRLGK